MPHEECSEFQAKVDQITEELHSNEEELYAAEEEANRLFEEIEEMTSEYMERYYNTPPQDRLNNMEFAADEMMLEMKRSELEEVVNRKEQLIAQRELLSDELQSALDELACCEARCWSDE